MSVVQFDRAILGRTGAEVTRLGISASYGMPGSAVERAIDRGLNYVYWGSFRRPDFAAGLRRVNRDRFLLVLQSYSRLASTLRWSVERGLKKLGFGHADILLLGMWNKPVWGGVLNEALRLKERGLARFLALSTHNRPFIPRVASEDAFDVVHVRYNAVHTGAERDVFPHLPAERRPGVVAFTATSWKQLLGHRRIPKAEKVPTATDCYRFVLSNPNVDVCMTGLGSAEHLDQALAALDKGPMSAEEMEWMRRVGKAIYGSPGS